MHSSRTVGGRVPRHSTTALWLALGTVVLLAAPGQAAAPRSYGPAYDGAVVRADDADGGEVRECSADPVTGEVRGVLVSGGPVPGRFVEVRCDAGVLVREVTAKGRRLATLRATFRVDEILVDFPTGASGSVTVEPCLQHSRPAEGVAPPSSRTCGSDPGSEFFGSSAFTTTPVGSVATPTGNRQVLRDQTWTQTVRVETGPEPYEVQAELAVLLRDGPFTTAPTTVSVRAAVVAVETLPFG